MISKGDTHIERINLLFAIGLFHECLNHLESHEMIIVE